MSFFSREKSKFYQENSILNITDYVEWKKQQGIYNFKSLPEVAIIAIKKNAFLKFLNPFKKRIKGIHGMHYQYNSRFLFCSEFGMGSSSIITLLEELKELGVKKFIFIGIAGILGVSINTNDAYGISSVYSSTGSSFFYYKNENIQVFDSDWLKKLLEVCKISAKTSWSTDCPFRETVTLVDYYKSKDCTLVDMEVGGFYAFSNFYQMPSAAILIGGDSLVDNKWNAPKKYNKLLERQQSLISKIINHNL